MSRPTPIHAPTLAEDGVLRPTHLVVDVDRIAANYAAIRAHVGATPVMPVVKANAYGHGLVAVGRLFDRLGAPVIGLAYLEEAIALRRAGVRVPILVLGGIVGRQLPLFLEHDVSITASSVDKLAAIDACAGAMGTRAKVHLKIDTGMERIGVHWYSAEALLAASLELEHVDVHGVFSHFANSDAEDLTHARLQLERFDEALAFYARRSLPTPTRHIANSGAIAQLPAANLDLVRPGILLYGVYPSDECARTVPVQPAMRWNSKVVYFKVVEAGNGVSYGSTWAPDHQVRVVTVPVGYGDGYPRRMSGSAEVLLHGKRYPVVGTICMDQVMVNIEWDSAYNDDEVVLLGEADGERITVEELARWAGTIPYEILTGINTRVPRVYVGGDG